MSGMERATGKRIDGAEHIAQSIRDILTTPISTRVMRRDYGSRLFELIDAPLNAVTRQLIAAASAGAIARWEPRVKLSRIIVGSGDAAGKLTLLIEGARLDLPGGAPLNLSIAF
ncbi:MULTISPECIES: GPW/gp25 family protein [Sphingobium]|uniref:GPW/gp25 family protein n=1 Tax=Sphingobium TaxID=165695 RepID=UPI0015EB3255|nr:MULTISPECIES: GPW/gp25 family protein [Sphingobium]MCW2362443.1 phage baseplate assembly protein W [Sphingobium sp. B10D3B]MCW2400877.1 phage baseplate assembly protein W [Sphingobium sp. B10D7B]MCW2407856.1 phage baseplate assembly protein W [Sphingobium xanthum]